MLTQKLLISGGVIGQKCLSSSPRNFPFVDEMRLITVGFALNYYYYCYNSISISKYNLTVRSFRAQLGSRVTSQFLAWIGHTSHNLQFTAMTTCCKPPWICRPLVVAFRRHCDKQCNAMNWHLLTFLGGLVENRPVWVKSSSTVKIKISKFWIEIAVLYILS